MYPAWGSVAGEKGRSGILWRHQCLNITLVYSIVLGHSILLWIPIPLEEHISSKPLGPKSARIYIYSEGSAMHIFYLMKGVRQLKMSSVSWFICQMWGDSCSTVHDEASGMVWYSTFILCSPLLKWRKDFGIDFKEGLLKPKVYIIAKKIVPKHLGRNIGGIMKLDFCIACGLCKQRPINCTWLLAVLMLSAAHLSGLCHVSG